MIRYVRPVGREVPVRRQEGLLLLVLLLVACVAHLDGVLEILVDGTAVVGDLQHAHPGQSEHAVLIHDVAVGGRHLHDHSEMMSALFPNLGPPFIRSWLSDLKVLNVRNPSS